MNQLAVVWPDAATLVRWLEPLQALAVAVLDEDGNVPHANRGFRRLIGSDEDTIAANAAKFLVLPTIDTLRAAEPQNSEGTVYRGRITFVHPSGDATSLRGEVRRREATFLLVAEHETEQLQAMTSEMIELTEQMAQTQRELIRAKKELEVRERSLTELAVTDSLTGLANRRELDRRLAEEVVRSERTGSPLSVVMIDLDQFKGFNDHNGHLIGDNCLEVVAEILVKSTRAYDVVARYGGEEFALVLPGTDEAEATARAESIRQAIEQAEVPGTDAQITASFGVAQVDEASPGTLLRAADEALYVAKRAGRNRVHAAGT